MNVPCHFNFARGFCDVRPHQLYKYNLIPTKFVLLWIKKKTHGNKRGNVTVEFER